MLILKGIIIGIGKIIPGVSGSMLAISLGIYEKLINSINSFLKNKKDNFKFLSKIAIGVIISIVLFSNIIQKSLNRYYLVTMLFFIGLIIGGFDDIKTKIENKSRGIFYISIIIIFMFGLININNRVQIENKTLFFLYLVFIGFVDALTTIIPGISGTATLMMLGAYEKLISTLSNLFDFYYLEDNLRVLIPFVLGFVIGVIFAAKLVQYLFSSYKSKTYSAILGFSIATILLMLIKSFNSVYTVTELIIGFLFLISGLFITKKINHLFLVD